MLMLSLSLALVRGLAVLIPWMLNLATWALARSLNMPEPLVHDTGVFAELQYIGLRRSGGEVAA